ncbi:MAG: cation:dicarboxylate symporter family transporter [Brevinema sp.]
MFKMGLLPRIILGLIIGIAIGLTKMEVLVRLMVTFTSIFGSLLSFTVPLMILAFISAGIAQMGNASTKILGIAVGLAYLSSISVGFGVTSINMQILPKILASATTDGISIAESIKPFFTIDMPPLLTVIGALIFSFIIGVGVTRINNSSIKSVLVEFNTIISRFLAGVIIPLLPIHIAGVFADLTYSGQITVILGSFVAVFGIVILYHMATILVLYTIASLFSKMNPFKAIYRMIPAYLTALGTQSSAATIPITTQCMKNNNIKKEIAEFMAPLCATIHLCGSVATISTCAFAVAYLNGIQIDFLLMGRFILMLGVMTVAAPGVPGGAVMAALGILQSILGFNEQSIALMISLYIAQDSFGTACNVTGSGALAAIVDNIDV